MKKNLFFLLILTVMLFSSCSIENPDRDIGLDMSSYKEKIETQRHYTYNCMDYSLKQKDGCGNGNLIPGSGETFYIDLKIENLSLKMAEYNVVQLFSDSSKVSIENEYQKYDPIYSIDHRRYKDSAYQWLGGSIPSKEKEYFSAQYNFQITFSNDCRIGDKISFKIKIHDALGEYHIYPEIDIDDLVYLAETSLEITIGEE